MNKTVLNMIGVIFILSIILIGCEVQSTPVHTRPVNSDIEDSVTIFSTSIDPFEKYSRNEVYAMLEEFMHANPDVYATGFGATGAGGTVKDFYYIYKDGTTYITIDGFDYGSVDKGVLASLQDQVALGEQFWSPEYVREDGSGNMITVNTFFTPIANDSGRIVYVLTVDQIEGE